MLASLAHPNIGAIHGIEDALGIRALVLELVEGPTLAERIAHGPVPLDEALPIAAQIAEALQAAHSQGVVHRDLKPANIKVRLDGTIKVLDFGLAKAVAAESGAAEPSTSPTISLAASQAGVILGTAAYMAPEQAKGKPVDQAADVWAFGCVLFEMLTGRRTFEGDDVSDTLAAILKSEPDWTRLPPSTPAAIRRLLRRCLTKDRRNRIADIAVARLEIADAQREDIEVAGATDRPRSAWRRALPLVATAVVTAVVVTAAARMLARPERARTVRFTVPLPSTDVLPETAPTRPGPVLALSPDGATLVYVATREGIDRMYRRRLDALEPVTIPGTDGARYPFFSPDGQWIGFQAEGKLKKVPVGGGPSAVICDLPALFFGASWGENDRIVFSADEPTVLFSVPTAGGAPERLAGLEPDEGALRWPHVLPGAGAIVITSFPAEGAVAPRVVSVALNTGERRVLIEGTHGRYSPTGHLLFSRDTTLWAVPFDVGGLAVVGDPFPVLEGVNLRGGGNSDLAVADNGTVAYLPGYVSISNRTLVWVDREGVEEALPAPPRAYVYPRISPDGTRLAVQISDQENDIWVWDFEGVRLSRLTFDRGVDAFPTWSPDSRRIAYSSQREGIASRLFWQEADGRGSVERLTDGTSGQFVSQFPHAFSPDGTRLIFREAGDLKLLNLDGTERIAEPLVGTTFNEQNAEVSPDGRWLAYQSSESGRDEVYVRPFPGVDGGRWQVSTDGGSRPLWSRDRRELFYLSTGDRRLMLATVGGSGSGFVAGAPRALRVGGPQYMLYGIGTFPGRTFDVSPDGRRFLLVKLGVAAEEGPPTTAFVVILDWFEELRRLARDS